MKQKRNGLVELVKEFGQFLKQGKKWWLWPLVIILLLLGALIVFASSSALAPFMYPFM
jgi:cytochrome c-type biogenesis protein CcmH/NrfF